MRSHPVGLAERPQVPLARRRSLRGRAAQRRNLACFELAQRLDEIRDVRTLNMAESITARVNRQISHVVAVDTNAANCDGSALHAPEFMGCVTSRLIATKLAQTMLQSAGFPDLDSN